MYNHVFYVGFKFVSNLIVFLFNHFLVFFVGFNVRVVCERLVKFYEDEEFTTSSRVPTQERPYEKHMLEFEESLCQAEFRESLRDSGQFENDLQYLLPRAF